MLKDLHEMGLIRELCHLEDDLIQTHELGRVNVKSNSFPIIGFTIGSQDPSAPTLGLFGGVHGLEKVGSHVVLAYLSSLFKQIKWDQELREILKVSRIVSIPLINPGGMFLSWRANPRGVDLMRNAPVDCEVPFPTFLVSGHRLSNKIPWYRGEADHLEIESEALVDFVKNHMFQSKAAVSIDFHSGFGVKDRLWFPYAKTNRPFSRIKEVQSLKDLLDEVMPYHIYHIEPQFASYNISGDLWDYLFDMHEAQETPQKNIFIPWTLEMGSWIWVRKNPLQIFKAEGFFNPVKAHRYDRTMRRHMRLIDFMFRAVRNFSSWA